ncbi:MAG: aspartate/glutamate racemase family protein [Holophagales bacterium]|nr:MAG: aspartate/glutamate racemase family protein [Holophagales bacterium]
MSESSMEVRTERAVAPLLVRDSLQLLVTDSGLGGLSVVAELERSGRGTGRYRTLRLDFVSALGETGQGYNKMPSHARKLAVFDDALAGMLGEGRPDMLLVACNTLSVLIPESRVLAAQSVPVLGIVELGVAAVAEHLAKEPEAVAVLFATETTIDAGAHQRALTAAGVAEERIVPLPCPGLASRIELEGRSVGVVEEIARFARQAVARTGRAPVVAALACTHYGYCAAIFAAMLRRAGAERVDVLDPNRKMSELFFPTPARQPAIDPQVSVRVVSRAIPLPGEIRSIAELVEPVSPATALALRNYELRRDLFPFTGLDG